MIGNRERLSFRFLRIVEGDAEGRFAISAFVALVLVLSVVLILWKGIAL